jgi:hypothetical protein
MHINVTYSAASQTLSCPGPYGSSMVIPLKAVAYSEQVTLPLADDMYALHSLKMKPPGTIVYAQGQPDACPEGTSNSKIGAQSPTTCSAQTRFDRVSLAFSVTSGPG